MDDVSKSNEETSKKTSEKVEDEKLEEQQPVPETPSKEVKEEISEEKQPEPEAQAEETSDDQIEEKEEPVEEKTKEEKTVEPETGEEQSVEGQPAELEEEKPIKTEDKREDSKKKEGKKDDFKYIVRIADTDLDGDKTIVHGLTKINGVGFHMGVFIADAAGIERNKKIGDLTDAQVDKIKEVLHNLNKDAPRWMVNHRRDYETGKDIHLIGSDIDMRLRDEINIMKKIRSYRGIRHERGLPVRGQRTRANSRTGLTLGVSKKGAQQARRAGKEKE